MTPADRAQLLAALGKLVRSFVIFAVCLGLLWVLFPYLVGGVVLLGYEFGYLKDGRWLSRSYVRARYLQQATQKMAIDGLSADSAVRGWPGDTGGSFDIWARQLIEDQYLTTNEFSEFVYGPGYPIVRDRIAGKDESSLLVYAVRADSPETDIFITTANFTNTPTGGTPPVSSRKPTGYKNFVAIQKGGGGIVYQARDAGKTNIIGTFAPLCH